ncbi:MAG: FG-GAP-like repeat-containing protein [Gammaproteobacteria bacterium]|nr:FG-GAP-like repeat-containing protein [Gammaproteobacteria bacterium]
MWNDAGMQRLTQRGRSSGIALFAALITGMSGAGASGSLTSAGTPTSYATAALVGVASTSAAGRTPAEFGVSHSGAATYRIPLWTPPGIGEVDLDLALVYASRGGSGSVGVGWSIAGLSTIARCNRTWAQDGAASGVTNTLADRYCLDGQQLKLVSGTHGVAGAVYATEVETFSRIVANGAAGNGPASFTVTTKNGLIYEYGGSADSRVYAGASTTIRAWALSRVRDRAGVGTGNAITLTYANEAQYGAYTNGVHRIASITYPTTATGAGPFYRVDFAYSARPASDVPMGYLAGNLVRDPYQLDRIAIQAVGAATPIKTYALGYETAPVSGRLRLASVQECAASTCLQPTAITYQNGASGWQPMIDTGVAVSSTRAPVPLELNGDGVTDLLYPVDAGSGRLSWRILLGTPAGFAAPFDTGLVTTTTHTIIPGGFAGNGRTQFLVAQSGYWYVAGYTNAGFAVANTGLVPAGEYGAADFDGDGRADLVAQSGGLTPTIHVRRNVSAAAGTSLAVQFATTTQSVWTIPSLRKAIPWDNLRVADLNGDGRADIVALSFNSSERNPKFWATPLLSNGFGNAFTVGTEKLLVQESMVTMADWNADGCSDVLQVQTVFVSNCAGAFVEIATRATAATGATLYTALPADWNGDGRADLLYIDAATRKWFVVRSTGEGAAAPASTGISAPTSTAWFDLDADGDGLTDLGYRDGNNGNRLRYLLHAGPAAPTDLATAFVDGFGVRQNLAYVSIARSNHTRLNDAVFPAADFQGPLYVVSEFSATDGTGGTYRNRLQYSGAQLNLQGRGFQGFATQRIEDSRTGLVTLDSAARAFPYTGMHVQRDVFQANGTTPVRQWKAVLGLQAAGTAGSEQRVFPFVASTSTRQFEHGGVLNGALVTEAATTFTYGDGYGSPTQVQTTMWDRDPYSPHLNSAWRSTSSLGYANDPSGNWCLGLPVSRTTTSTAPDQPALTQTTTYVTDPVACRITQQVIEPNNPASKVITSFGFDGCGNLNSVRTVGSNPNGSAMPARTASFNYGSRCQLPESATNAAAETTTYEWRYDFGVPARVTDPNGLSTTWSHDPFGRRVSETASDGTRRTWTFQSCGTTGCWGTGELRFLVYDRNYAADGALIREHHSYYDGYERRRLEEYHGALGAWLHRTYDYDAAGRMTRESRPYANVPNGHTIRTFDPLGRTLSERDYDAAGVTVRNSSVAYAGRTTTLTDALGRSRSRFVDVAGNLRRAIDPSPGGTTRYDYDSLGHLNRIQDAIGAVSTGTYDVRGFRTQWSDADAGAWNFTRNSLGEVVAWTDANGRSFASAYDALGRRVSRTEPEGTSTWTWGSSAAARNIGRLQSKAGLGYSEALAYDGLGRVSTRTITTDQGYRYDYTYNSSGEIDTLTYPTSPVPSGQSGARLRLRYSYNFGTPTQIDDVTLATPRTLWKLNAVSDFDSPTQESLAGNAIARSSSYDLATQRLTARQAGTASAGSARQNLAYQWDAAGNLLQRRDLNQALTEAFTYDALDRVTNSTLNGSTNLSVSYDAAGNVLQKSDIGSYVYGNASRPHAVTAAGSEAFTYDRNGNLASRNGLAQDWASFNLPTTLRKPGYQAQIAYGPDRERWRQVASYQNGTETTHYAGSLLEKESTTSTGVTYWRHYVPTPGGSTVVVSRNSNGTTSTTYVVPDHLGSSDTLLNEAGSTVARQSFGTFGTRRGSNWSAATAPDWLGIANTTRQGFTGHEMLDNVGLVHMNGRVYDPALGRFLSADPLIGDLADSQSLNPYAYVGNRPLNATDPTGYLVDGGLSIYVGKFVVDSILSSLVYGLFNHGGLPPPPATALPGQSAQNGVGLCGAGTFSPTCGGTILYAGAPGTGRDGVPTSTWAETLVDDEYAQENLERFFIDLGINAVDILILSPVHDARDAYDAARRGDNATAILYVGFTVCDVAKPCQSILSPAKALRRAAKSTRAIESGGLNLYRAGRDGNLTRGAAGHWKDGDWMLFLPNRGSAKANWQQNAGKLRAEMRRQEPIHDSYRTPSGLQIPAGATPGSPGRFLNAERKLLESRGWQYNTETGAYHPPKP